ncbi:hypothetical protein [Alloalcanivorax gelatiniphagus]|uniref:Uncharacterized protein n=1 Tax=Alloalcanivorax gelatiniphagus TaxID=1194167 RepID=A0ABY2XRF5_9GAMM|nr:hypothetical protein [Alloalcanivorax gelatiniphagus]TMW14974.1 hypothetical protein FGS76_01340 [Alloalcanivorax gelatiniphagus]
MNKVIRVDKKCPERALENLNRLTGLDFQSWPESLLDVGEQVATDNLEAPAERPEQEQEQEQARGAARGCRAAGQ